MQRIAYKREIDGLRAIAVSAVVGFHAGGLCPAGFVGVDVFFVISGYLITALLLKEHASVGRIDLAAFYARRIRRILPAAFTLIVLTLGLWQVAFPASAVETAARSATAASFFVANIYFQLTTGGYFDRSPEGMPLLHLWSLSVEEQFYILWPALLIVLLRYRTKLVPVLSILGLASFALAEWLVTPHPNAAFYEMPARFWELAAGGLVAALPVRSLPAWTTWTGLAIVLASCLFPMSPFPASGALPAVAGTTLLLAAINGGRTNAILGSKPMVGIGLVSFSLYLWHWPLLVLYNGMPGGHSTTGRVVVCGLAALLAVASYRYVETPFRRPGNAARTIAVGCSAVLLLAGVSFVAFKLPASPALTRAQSIAADRPDPEQCSYGEMDPIGAFPKPSCNPSHPGVALWGDSLALSWQPFAWKIAADSKTDPIGFTRPACPPLPGILIKVRASFIAESCRQFNQKTVDWLVSHGTNTLVVAARWQYYEQNDDEEERLAAALTTIAPHVGRILVFGPTPELPQAVPDCVETGTTCGLNRQAFEAKVANARSMMARIALLPKVRIIDPTGFLCSDTQCPGIRNGIALYSDNLHISSTAAARFAAQWR